MGTDGLIQRLRNEFTAMPGLRLTEAQVLRLCATDACQAAPALRTLVSAGFLRLTDDGTYMRADVFTRPPDVEPARSPKRVTRPSWRRILCLVELDKRDALSASAHAAQRYATTLAVTHRARVTALHVIPRPPRRGTLARADAVPAAADDQEPSVAAVTERLR